MKIPNTLKEVEELYLLIYIAGRSVKWYSYSGKIWQFLINLSICLLCDPAIALVVFIPEKVIYVLFTQKLVHKL